MSLLRLASVVALRRTISNWKLEMVLFFAIVLAVALMSSGLIFSRLLAEAALAHSLGQASTEETNFQVRTFIGSETPPTVSGRTSAYQSRLDFNEERIATPFEPYLKDRSRLLESPTFFYQGHPQLELADDVRTRGDIQYMSGLFPQRANLVHGRWPYSSQSGIQPFKDGELEVAIDVLGAELLQLGAGDEMEIFPATAFTDPPAMTAKIVGVFELNDPDNVLWFGVSSDFSFQNERWTMVPLFTTEPAIVRHMVGLYPTLFLDVTWSYQLDRLNIRASDVDKIQNLVRGFSREVYGSLSNGSIAIKLDRLLNDYKAQLLPTRVPMFLIIFLVTGILIYYLGLVAGLIVKSRNTELALLKSRGATTPQLGLLALVESVLLAVPAVILGPILALAVVRLLGKLFFGLGGGGDLAEVPVTLSTQAFILGLGGGILAVAALTGFTLLAARQGIVEFRQGGARPPRVPFIHRYYLDFLMLALIGIMWWQTQNRESFLVRSLGTGELEIDYSLLLGPILGLLAIGLLVLRFFPIAVSLATGVMEPVGPSWLVHGLRHVSRDPIMPGVLVIMLMLATALGIIGSTFSSTLERSREDQALYAAGADLLVEHAGTNRPLPPAAMTKLVRKAEGVAAASEVRRARAALLTKGFSTANVSLLAVDTANFGQVAWYRPDFADGRSLNDLLSLLKNSQTTQAQSLEMPTLPEDAGALALWVRPSRPDNRLILQARLKDSLGRFFDVDMGSLGFREWRQMVGELIPLPLSGRRGPSRERLMEVSPPFSVVALYLVNTFGPLEPGALFLGRLSAITPGGEVILDDFQDLESWHVLEDYTRPDISFYALESSQVDFPEGRGQPAAFSWAAGGIGLKGVHPGPPETPTPAIVSRSLLEQAQIRIGDTINLSLSTYTLPLKVMAVADYFPTVDPSEIQFAIVDLELLNNAANLHSPRPVGGTNEIWIDLYESESGIQTNNADSVTKVLTENGIRFREVRLASQLVSESVNQPLVNAGWGALLVLVFLVLLLASASGVMLFTYVDTRERQIEFALLRTLGSSTSQLNAVVWFGVVVIVACGIANGTLVGFQTGVNLLPLMGIAKDGVPVVPPMVLKINWTTLIISYLALAAVTAGTVVWLAWFSAKLEVQRALRIGEA